MASILSYSSLINDENEPDDDLLSSKRLKKKNKTLKIHSREAFDNQRVNTVLEQLQQHSRQYNAAEDDEHDASDDDYHPPKPQQPPKKEPSQKKHQIIEDMDNRHQLQPTDYKQSPNNMPYSQYANPTYNDILTHQAKLPSVDEYYNSAKKQPTYQEPSSINQKLNYMITMLEEQQDSQTNNVVEEVILYSFLGIFMIFIVDTCCKTKKYTR